MKSDYQRIEKAIYYIENHASAQPDLDEVARQVNLSPFHFQRLFKEWAGVSPKKFLQYISIERAKELLKKKSSLLDASLETGLSGTSRLHDLFVTIEGMTPGEYKNGAESLVICYEFSPTIFGKIIVAATDRGICHLAFIDDEASALKNLRELYGNAKLMHQKNDFQKQALKIFDPNITDLQKIKLHLKATPFQLKVWQALLRIPSGELSSYSTVANKIRNAKAVRAVGSAIASNPVAYLIPCHRVIQSTGLFGQYHWGATRKLALIGWEGAKAYGEI